MTSSTPDTLPVVHADSDGSATSRVVGAVKSAVRVPESEIKRWRRTFDANANAVVKGEKCVLLFIRSCPPSDRVTSRWRRLQVLGPRTVCQCDRAQGRPDAYRPHAVRDSLSRRGRREARSLVVGRFCGLSVSAQAARRGLLHRIPIL
jgi:hypothetical protein